MNSKSSYDEVLQRWGWNPLTNSAYRRVRRNHVGLPEFEERLSIIRVLPRSLLEDWVAALPLHRRIAVWIRRWRTR